MYLIAGLGNPGREYEMTRHNIGFEVIDYIADKYGVKVKKLKFKGLFNKTEIGGEDVILLKPQTYMNLSGESIRDFSAFFKIPPEKIIVISDDVYLDEGRIRIRKNGSAGGHNGLKSIIYQLNSDNFIRIRIGVGEKQEEGQDLADFVLSRFTKSQIPIFEQAIINASDAVSEIIKNGVESAMNKFNGI
ncbi:MAG: aminoacyl-tRNA hydrolase [Clostridia bacterium]|nr:aminoacyl-tRNA hydrolase [Clostridia bacterium]